MMEMRDGMSRVFLPLATAILLVAAFLRLNQLSVYPPGPHYDEAANLILTRTIAYDGANLFPIAENYQGRESLYYYVNAPLLRLIANDIFTMRVVSAFMNLITIVASMTLGRLMFRGQRGVIIGLTAGLLMTLSFHQILMSRQVFRAVSLPMMQALALAFLFRGLRSRAGWRWLALGGLFAGGALYTYMASRLFPLWLALGGIALLWFDRANLKFRLRQGALFFGAMTLAALPMILYAIRNTDIFFQRLTEVSDGAVTVSLWESVQRHLKMFFIQGDASTRRYNILQRPYFTLPEGVLLLIAIAVVIYRIRRKDAPTERAAYRLALLSPFMIIPSVISVAGLPPSHMRSLGMVPLIFVLVAVGAEFVFSAFLRRFPQIQPRHALMTAILLTVIVGGVLMQRRYIAWARDPALFYEADADLASAADWLSTTVSDDTLVFVSALHREHPTIIAGYDHPVTWLGTDSLFLPPPNEDAIVIFSRNTPPPDYWQTNLQSAQITDIPLATDGTLAFWAYRINADSPALTSIDPPLNPGHNPYMTLLGVSSDPLASGERSNTTTVWRIDQPPPYYRLRPILELRDSHGTILSSSDAFLLGTNAWRTGETMLQRLTVNVPLGTPPGDYPLFMTWVDRDSGTFVSFIGEDDAYAGLSAQVGSLEVERPQTFASPDKLVISVRQPLDVAPGVRLLGWNPPVTTARPGETLKPTFFWQALESDVSRADFDVTAILQNETESVVIWQGVLDYPPDHWVDGELVTDHMRLIIPHQIPSGDYTLVVQIDDQPVEVSTIHIEGVPRVFDPPPVDEILNARLGDSLVLYGYTVDFTDGVLTLDLVWKATQTVDQDYTVFVHLVDENGVTVDQRDAMPVNNSYPTSLWSAGEFIVDRYTFSNIDAKIIDILAGMYIQEDGRRLPIVTSEGNSGKDYIKIYTLDIELSVKN
jgi:4-amino-4-deoxy-L-arabinose transferase-like glycosyltransferase